MAFCCSYGRPWLRMVVWLPRCKQGGGPEEQSETDDSCSQGQRRCNQGACPRFRDRFFGILLEPFAARFRNFASKLCVALDGTDFLDGGPMATLANFIDNSVMCPCQDTQWGGVGGWGGGGGGGLIASGLISVPGTLNVAGSRHFCLGLFSKELVFAGPLWFGVTIRVYV